MNYASLTFNSSYPLYIAAQIQVFMIGVFIVLAGMTAFGISNVCWKPLLFYYSTFHALFLRSVITVAVMLLLGTALRLQSSNQFVNRIFFEHSAHWTAAVLPSFASILISLTGLSLFVYSVSFNAAGISGLLICCSSVFSALLGWIFRSETITILLLCSFALTIAGVFLLDDWSGLKKTSTKGVMLALGGALCWAVANIGFKKNIAAIGVLPFSLLQEFTVLCITGGLWVLKRKKHEKTSGKADGKAIRLICLISSCTVAGIVCSNLGLNGLPVVVFSLIVMAQPLTTLITARLWLKEKLTRRQQAGAFFVIAGLFLALLRG